MQACGQFHQGGLAAAGRSDNRGEFAAVDVDGEILDGEHAFRPGGNPAIAVTHAIERYEAGLHPRSFKLPQAEALASELAVGGRWQE